MPTALVTGANRGIGLEFARQYAKDGWRVIATCRDPERAKDLRKLGDSVSVHKLDVADAEQVAALARALEGEPIDLLVNNAGIMGGAVLDRIDYAAWEEVLRVNTLAPVRIAEALLANIAASERRLIVAITSRMGSIAESDGGYYPYRSSKAALNAAMRSLAVDLAPRRITVALFHPGWVRTDMGGRGAQVAPKDSVAGMRAVIARLKLADSGRFFNYDGSEIPW
jgi:NAD(P)-dependent dehydrogenase (short-subunit alcohol dehydrogenase family)